MTMKRVLVRLKRSPIGYPKKQRKVLESLGLRKLNVVVEKDLTPQIQGMIKKVSHLVDVEELE